jgi:CRP-like cAMP-binding protein
VDLTMERQADTIEQEAINRPNAAELRGVAIFQGVEDRILERLAAIAESRVVEAGTLIYPQGQVDTPFCLLLSGQISSFRTAPDGTVTVVDVTQPSGHAGLQTLLTQLPTLTGIQAVATSRMILIDGAGLRALLTEEPSLSNALLRAEAMALRSLVLQVCDLKLRTTAQRLGHYLLELAPDKTSRSVSLRLPFDKRLLAARLGCRQENLSRAFAALREIGVETRGSRVVLNDVPRLRDYAVAFDGMEPA